jgi:hypothetical protein
VKLVSTAAGRRVSRDQHKASLRPLLTANWEDFGVVGKIEKMNLSETRGSGMDWLHLVRFGGFTAVTIKNVVF